MLNIIKWSAEHHLQVIGISDTNISKQQGKHINNNELDNMEYRASGLIAIKNAKDQVLLFSLKMNGPDMSAV